MSGHRGRRAANRERRAELDAARRHGLAHRHAAKLRHLAERRDHTTPPDQDGGVETVADDGEAAA